MMETFKLHTYIGTDGLLKVELPTEIRNAACDIVIVLAVRSEPDSDWVDFVNRTYGSLADDPIERPAPLRLEERDPIE